MKCPPLASLRIITLYFITLPEVEGYGIALEKCMPVSIAPHSNGFFPAEWRGMETVKENFKTLVN